MLEMILMTALAAAPAPRQTTAQFKPCVLPNKCVRTVKSVQIAALPKIGTCALPNRCS